MPQPPVKSKPAASSSKCELRVCQGGYCGPDGGESLLRDIEELCNDKAIVLPTTCLGHCGEGPNVEVAEVGSRKEGTVVEGLQTFEEMEALLNTHVGNLDRNPLSVDIARQKFQARREEDPTKKVAMIEEAMSLVQQRGGGDPLAGSLARSELLLLRSEATLETDPASSIRDAEEAVALNPNRAAGHEALSICLEEVGRLGDSAIALEKAINLGIGIDVGVAKRKLKKIQKAASEQQVVESSALPTAAGNSEEGSGKPPQPPDASRNREDDGAESFVGFEEEEVGIGDAIKNVEVEENHSTDYLEWTVQKTEHVNYNCIRIVLSSMELEALRASAAEHSDMWHVDLCAEIDGKEVVRSYTPLSSLEDWRQGTLELLVKVYEDGSLTQYLKKLIHGRSLLVSRPLGTLNTSSYTKDLLVIAGGSAATVALQLCVTVIRQTMGSASIHLIFCNRAFCDVLCRERFRQLQILCPKLRVTHVLDDVERIPNNNAEVGQTWTGGPLSAAALTAVRPGTDAVVSGPPGLCRAALDVLGHCGWQREQIQVLDSVVDHKPKPKPKLNVGQPVVPPPLPATSEVEPVAVREEEEELGFWASLFDSVRCKRRNRPELEDDDFDPETGSSYSGGSTKFSWATSLF